MEVLYACCCGLDVHKETVVACVRIQEPRGRAKTTVRSFGATTAELLELHQWLTEQGCTHVAMESTSVYWKPVFNLLEGSFEVLLANARHIKAVPGRKTDVKDCEWIADLLAHGLIRASFIPPAPIRELRDITRHRKSLIRDKATLANRVGKLLETANIKLSNVVSDVLGVSGRAMLAALIAGERDPKKLAALARGRLIPKAEQLAEALRGGFSSHHAFLLEQLLKQIDHLAELIAACDARVVDLCQAHREPLQRLRTIPGVAQRTAEVLLSEIGLDMTRFPTAGHLASWARMCPGNNESAGKRRSGATGTGNNWLRTTLLESAWAASRSRKTYLGAQYRRIARRRGPKRAATAVAHSILVIAFYVLRDGVEYRDLGPDYFDRANAAKLTKYHLRRLAELGYELPQPRAQPGA
ncbi:MULTISPECIES: IS110 family transposase [Sorangium]|uniref:Transposase n=1 Tax=Sorangium cellulosum TaxID=56 RepID=A0A4P2R454_SORCE|nr:MULTISPECIES: IS110 family transposase [Sorangium]AUX37508.1 transposase [Sorangium cellulosum]WCQ96799.1 IS110 family transposase ISAzo28 [Sorangium sp. Soce836]